MKRDPSFDIVKIFLMYFVIKGHLVPRGVVLAPTITPPEWISCAVIGASMPCFFLISGYFARKTFEDRSWIFIFARAICFIWPVIAFGTVCGLGAFFRGKIGGAGIFKEAFLFLDQLWFLRTLAINYLMVAFLVKITRNQVARLGALVGCYAFLVLLSGLRLRWVADVMHMFPYFIFGLWLNGKKIWLLPKWFLMSGVIFWCIVLLEGNIHTNDMAFYWCDTSWSEMLGTIHGLACFLGRTVVGIAGSIFLLAMADGLIRTFPRIGSLGGLGTATLGVYVFHQYLLTCIGKLPGFPVACIHQWWIALGVFLTCHCCVMLIKRFRWVNFFVFGDERLCADALNAAGRNFTK